jgi:hypothetical protein
MILMPEARLAGHVTQASLLPIVPILLLPFILVFFVVVVPIWGVTLGVLGLVLLGMRGCNWVAHRFGVHALDGPTKGLHRALRWVLTFGGFTERGKLTRE